MTSRAHVSDQTSRYNLPELIVRVSGEKSFTLPGLARATPATGVVRVQEQLV